MPLVRGRYPTTSPLWSVVLGQTQNVVDPSVPGRSNAEVLSIGGMTDGALAATGVCAAVAVPVDYGTVVSKITYFVGATAAGTPTHSFAALYSGIATPALLAQSADATNGAIAASGAYTVTLATAQLISPTNAPNGFVYVSISQTASTISTAAVVSTPAAVGYQWFSTGPLFWSATHGSAVGGTAPATIASPAAKAVAPIVVLT